MLSRGFISPLIDDLPTLIFVIMTLTVFFYIMSFCLDVYKEKVEKYNFERNYLLYTNMLLSNGIMSDFILKKQLDKIKNYAKIMNYGFDACTDDNCCRNIKSDRIIVSKYVVPWYQSDQIVPKIVKVCLWEE